MVKTLLFNFLFKQTLGVIMEAIIGKFFTSKMGLKLLFSVLKVLAKRTDNTLDDEIIAAIEDALV